MTEVLTYGTLISTIRHSANASWSGFNYQGLCALHYALVLLKTDWDGNKSKKLNLEGYEDFSILDSNDLIISLHQCKCYNSPQNFTAECKKMHDKHEYWNNHNQLSPYYDQMYFHTNQINTYFCGINSYKYNTKDGLCGSQQILDLINDEIATIIQQRNIAGSKDTKRCRLIDIIIHHVEELHEQQKQTKKDMFEIAIAQSIPFDSLIKALEKDNDDLSVEEKARTCRHYITFEMNELLVNYPVIQNGSKVIDFMTELDSLGDYSLIQFVRRLFPDEDILHSHIDELSIKSKERADSLFNVINEVNDQIDYGKFDWENRGCKQSPSTLGSNIKPEVFCSKIVKNSYSSDLRRDYRWIVGDIKYMVEDVDQGAMEITQIKEKDYDDITQPNKIGLLDINSKNNGKY